MLLNALHGARTPLIFPSRLPWATGGHKSALEQRVISTCVTFIGTSRDEIVPSEGQYFSLALAPYSHLAHKFYVNDKDQIRAGTRGHSWIME